MYPVVSLPLFYAKFRIIPIQTTTTRHKSRDFHAYRLLLVPIHLCVCVCVTVIDQS